MTGDEQSQLRFDISEKIAFQKGQPGIDTLLSLDLTPEVRIEDLGANVKIEGVIRLSGTYLGESERSEPSADVRDWDEQLEAEEIEYIIPLEITLPSERIGQLEDITAEIQSFDYDVLSSHELGIEAVLVIDGLQLGSSAGHTIASFGKEEEESETASEGGAHDKDGEARNAKDVPEAPFGLRPQPLEQHGHASGEDVAPKEQSDGVENDDLHEQEGKAEEAADGDSAGSASEPVVERKEDREQLTDKRGDTEGEVPHHETKIHFRKKEEEDHTPDAVPLNELLHESPDALSRDVGNMSGGEGAQETKGTAETVEESGEATAAEETGDLPGEQTDDEKKYVGIEWMKEKLGGGEDRFHRLKIVIVQKDDTLEAIADRYNLSSVELLQVNKLQTGQLEEGQMIYIPVHD